MKDNEQMNKKSKVYIAGPMTGYECYNFEAFFVAARMLKQAGLEVINPAQHDTEKMFGGWVYSADQYPDVILEDLHLIQEEACCIMLLDGWTESPGACVELGFANAIGLASITQSDIVKEFEGHPFEAQKDVIREYITNAIEQKSGVQKSEG